MFRRFEEDKTKFFKPDIHWEFMGSERETEKLEEKKEQKKGKKKK